MLGALKRNHLCIYSCFFFVALVVFSAYLYLTKLSLVNTGDAITQHYPAFIYMGSWWKDTIASLVTLSPPRMWDYAIGYGADIIQTLTYYCLFDVTTVPFALLANEGNGPLLYTAMVFCKAYLAGLSLALLCRRMGCSVCGTAISSLAYIFCPYMLDSFWHSHHFFALPLIYMPLFMVCSEDLLENKKCLPFVFVVFFSALSSYYYLYMEIALTVLYVIVRCIGVDSFRSCVRLILKTLTAMAVYVLVGVMLAMPVLMPQVALLINDARVNAGGSIDFLYSANQYLQAIGGFVSSSTFSYYSYLGVSPCLWIAVVLLFLSKDKRRDLRWLRLLLVITTVSFLVPVLGYAMNGFTYVANRHSWFLALLISLAFATMWDKLLHCSGSDARMVLFTVTIYGSFVLINSFSRSKEGILGVAILFFVGLALLLHNRLHMKDGTMTAVLMTAVIVGIVLHTYFVFIDRGALSWLIKYDEVSEIYQAAYGDAYDSIDALSLWRLDYSPNKRRPNTINNRSGEGSTYSYWSFQNPHVVQYLDSNGLLDSSSYEFQGLAGRKGLQILLSGRCMMESDDEVGVSLVEDALPIAYTYDRALSSDDFFASTFGQKQVAQSSGCIVSNTDLISRFAGSYPTTGLVSFDIVPGTANQVEEGEFVIRDTNEPLVFKMKSHAYDGDDTELLLDMYSLEYLDDAHKDITISVQRGAKTQKQVCLSSYNRYYFGKRDHAFNLGNDNSQDEAFTVTFSEPGRYRYSSIIIEQVPIKPTGITTESITNIAMQRNAITCDVKTPVSRILYFSIPYSAGWHIFVDGEERMTYVANVMGIATVVGPDDNRIELRYETPYLKEGLYCAVFGAVILCGMLLRKKKCHSHRSVMDV